MKKLALVVLVLLVVGSLVLYLFREPLKEFAYARVTDGMFVAADDDAFDPGPAIGSRFPGLRALYQGREITLLDEFAGARGTVLVASRSFDWCPYCMRQLIQLQAHRPDYEAAGLGLVAITYDAPELHQVFIDKHGITIPLLSDIDALSFKTLGILNADYQPGDPRYGIPYPGMIVIDPQGLVVGKLFLAAYSSRVDAESALNFALHRLEGGH
mgnify:FL=1